MGTIKSWTLRTGTVVALTLCTIVRPAYSDSCAWSQRIGGPGSNDTVRAVAVAPNGETIVGGVFDQGFTLGATTLTLAGDVDGFVAGLAPTTGAAKWVQQFSGVGADDVQRVTVDGSGNIYVVGTFGPSAKLAGQSATPVGPTDVFIAKLDSGGAPSWVKTFGTPAQDASPRVAVAGNDVYLAWTGMGLSSCSTMPPLGGSDLLIAKLKAGNGAVITCKTIGGPNDEALGGMTVVPASGKVIVAISYDRVTNLGSGPLSVPGANSFDSAIAIYDSSLALLKARAFGGAAFDLVESVAIVDGDVAVVGRFGPTGTLDLGGGAIGLKGGMDAFTARYGLPALEFKAGKGVGGNADDFLREVASLGDEIAAVGDFQGTADFGTGTLSATTTQRDAVALVGPGSWSARYGSFAGDKGQAVASDGTGALVLGGSYSTQMQPPDFGCGQLPAAQGASDGWVARVVPSLGTSLVVPTVPSITPTRTDTPTHTATVAPNTSTPTRTGTAVVAGPTPFVDIEVPNGMPFRVRTKAP